MKLSALADALGLTLKGEDKDIDGLGTLESAGPTQVSFLANPKYAGMLAETKAAAVIVDAKNAEQVETALIAEDPYLAFAGALQIFSKPQGAEKGVSEKAFIDPTAEVHPSVVVYPFVFIGPRAQIGENVRIFPGCYVGEDCIVGKDSTLYPNVVLMAETEVGERCMLHPGVVLGGDGFGFAPTPIGVQKIPQLGIAKIGDDVEIGANTTIDRAALNKTEVGKGTKIDNMVMLGHNVTMGENCLIVSQVGISGSTKVGDRVTMAGQVGVAGHLKIGNDVTLGPKSGVLKDIPDGKTMGGAPAMDGPVFMRWVALQPKLPELNKRVRELEKKLEQLEATLRRGESDDV